MSLKKVDSLDTIEFLTDFVEYLWVTAHQGSFDELKKYSDSLLKKFGAANAFFASCSNTSRPFEIVYEYRSGVGKASGPKFQFDGAFADRVFQRDRLDDFIFFRKSMLPSSCTWASGDCVVVPQVIAPYFAGCLVLTFAADPQGASVFEVIKRGRGHYKFLAKFARSMGAWVHGLKNPRAGAAVSCETKMGLMGLGLSAKQKRILELVAQGEANKAIAGFVNLSEHAVKYHVGNLLEKFEVTNRAELRIKVNQMNFFQNSNY